MKSPAYMIIGTVIILVLSIFFLVITTAVEINAVGNRVEDCLIASGWAGFSKINLNELAKRKQLSSEEQRNIYLNKSDAVTIVDQYIRENMKLSDTYYAMSDSFINEKENPIRIMEITVYNPSDLPAVCTKGTSINLTTIHIVIQVPVKINFIGVKYFEKHVDVDVSSFYKN